MIMIAVEEAAFLLAVRRVVGGVDVLNDLRPGRRTFGMANDHPE